MLILTTLIILAMIGIVMLTKFRCGVLNLIGILCFISGLGFFVFFNIAFMIHYHKCVCEIVTFEEIRLIYERASANGDNIVEAFKAAESNQWLRKQQYWNEIIFDIAIPDEVMQLEVIK